MTAPELLAACPYCGAPAGTGCLVRAAHPVTGRGVLRPAGTVHPERVRAAGR